MIMQRSSVDFQFLSDGRKAVEITFVDTGDQADRNLGFSKSHIQSNKTEQKDC